MKIHGEFRPFQRRNKYHRKWVSYLGKLCKQAVNEKPFRYGRWIAVRMLYFLFGVKSRSEPDDDSIESEHGWRGGLLIASVSSTLIYRMAGDDRRRGARWLKGVQSVRARRNWSPDPRCGPDFCFRSASERWRSVGMSLCKALYVLICHAQWTPFWNWGGKSILCFKQSNRA